MMLEILASFSGDPTLTVRLGSVGAGLPGLVKVFFATGVSFDAGNTVYQDR
jgi:hypothetical protein